MHNRITHLFFALVCTITCTVTAACGSSPPAAPDASSPPPPPPPDARTTVPRNASGTFSLTGVLDLEVLPAPADALLATLRDATDGPDDPARYLCERLVAELPAGTWRDIADGAADLVAPFLQAKLDDIAPHFADGIRALTAGLGEVMHHAKTIDKLAIQADGSATRTITGVQFSATTIDFASVGLPDAVATTHVSLDAAAKLQIAAHHLDLPYGQLVRLGFDHQVIPTVDPDASSLGGALRDLVDCNQLGALFAAHIGVGSAGFYAVACSAGMTALAADIYDQLAAIDASPFELATAGTALAVDVDGDGSMDVITDGWWSGSTSYAGVAAPLVNASFVGSK